MLSLSKGVSLLISATTTPIPRPAKRRAVARPSPEAPPVTIAVVAREIAAISLFELESERKQRTEEIVALRLAIGPRFLDRSILIGREFNIVQRRYTFERNGFVMCFHPTYQVFVFRPTVTVYEPPCTARAAHAMIRIIPKHRKRDLDWRWYNTASFCTWNRSFPRHLAAKREGGRLLSPSRGYVVLRHGWTKPPHWSTS